VKLFDLEDDLHPFLANMANAHNPNIHFIGEAFGFVFLLD